MNGVFDFDVVNEAHWDIEEILRNEKGKELCEGAVTDKILEGHRVGGFGRRVGKSIVADIVRMKRSDGTFLVGRENFKLMRRVLLGGGAVQRWVLDAIEDARMRLEPCIHYSSLDPRTGVAWEIVEARNLDEGRREMQRFWRRGETKGSEFYVDTESSIRITPNGSNLAMIQLVDSVSGLILLWRVHRMTPGELRSVYWIVKDVCGQRGLCCFDKEEFFNGIRMRDIQPKWKNRSRMSLKDAAKKKGLTIFKSDL